MLWDRSDPGNGCSSGGNTCYVQNHTKSDKLLGGKKAAQMASRNRFLYFFLRVINEKCQRMVRLIWYHNQNTSAPLVYLYVFP